MEFLHHLPPIFGLFCVYLNDQPKNRVRCQPQLNKQESDYAAKLVSYFWADMLNYSMFYFMIVHITYAVLSSYVSAQI